jgi:hypothetical protein
MPRLWHDARGFKSLTSQVGMPDTRALLFAFYGPGWAQKAAKVHGRTVKAVRNWADRDKLPLEVERVLLERASNLRLIGELERQARADLEKDLAYRRDARAYALRWLRLRREDRLQGQR